jgi:hypothetical protein
MGLNFKWFEAKNDIRLFFTFVIAFAIFIAIYVALVRMQRELIFGS